MFPVRNTIKEALIDSSKGLFGLYKDNKTFISQSKKIHGDNYDYSLVNYKKSKEKVIIICKKHGEFKQTPNSHLKGNGCPICKESKGEKKIREFLIKNKITHTQQHIFNKCKNIQVLPFDFYLPDYNICIEYDGIQHFKPVKFFGGVKSFEIIKQNDLIKTKFCLLNNINLIRISYLEGVSDSLNSLIIK